jgi:ubiquinone/menaquinone biosynthesis C-methylase UbiE
LTANIPAPLPIQFDRVADIYDAYVQTDFDLSFWLAEAKAVHGRVLELTCGTGRVSIPLLRSGINLTCVDYAAEMLAQFRKKLDDSHLSCPLICQDIAELSLPDRCDLAFIPYVLCRKDRRRFCPAFAGQKLL